MKIGTKRQRSLRIVVLTILLSFAVTTVISVRSLNALIQRNAQSMTNVLSSGIFDAVNGEIAKISMAARAVSSDSLLIDILLDEKAQNTVFLEEKIKKYLIFMQKGIRFESAFIFPVTDTHVYGVNGSVEIDSDEKDYKEFMAFVSSGRPRIPVIRDDALVPGKKMFFIFSRIADADGRVAGVCGIGMPIETIRDVLAEFERRHSVRVMLADWDEKCALSTNDSEMNNLIPFTLPADYRHNRSYAVRETNDGGYVITRYLDEIGRFLVIRGSKPEGRDAFSSLIRDNVIAIIAIFLVLALITHFLMRSEHGKLEKKAFTDPLTGIANRAGLEAAIEQKVGHAGIKSGSLFILDLDHFKEINDTLGHPEGDKLLQHVASTLKTLFRETDVVARMGGDEFIVFAQTMDIEEDIIAKATSINQHIRKEYPLPNGSTITVTASIGIAIFPIHGATYSEIYKNADAALYASKESGKDRFTLFSERL